jgi:hypothetical protein
LLRGHAAGACRRFVAGGNAGDAADQLKQLIRELHRAGLEVLLEVSSAADLHINKQMNDSALGKEDDLSCTYACIHSRQQPCAGFVAVVQPAWLQSTSC